MAAPRIFARTARASVALGAAFLAYTGLTLVHTWPLARHLRDRLPNDAGDPALVAWILWWTRPRRR